MGYGFLKGTLARKMRLQPCDKFRCNRDATGTGSPRARPAIGGIHSKPTSMAAIVERATGFEPATLGLGSRLDGDSLSFAIVR